MSFSKFFIKSSKILTASILAVLLVFSLIIPVPALERDTVPLGLCLDDTSEYIDTIISFKDGTDLSVEGIIDLQSTEKNPVIESIESYDVRYKEKTVINVGVHDVFSASSTEHDYGNGYYSVTFGIPKTSKECFLTGLIPEKISHIQQMLIDSYIDDESFVLEDIDFIDAEKRDKEKDFGDSQLCWAGAASNMLHYSGWGRLAGFDTEDDLFDLFNENFTDDGFWPHYGITWFFSGARGTTDASLEIYKNFGYSGRYLPDYPVEKYLNSYYISQYDDVPSYVRQMTDDLKNGDAIGLAVEIDSDINHAVTLFGYVTDNSYDENDISHYCDLIISDSDDNIVEDNADRRAAPNTVRVEPFSLNEEYEGDQSRYTVGDDPLLRYTSLEAYSSKFEKETDPSASRDRLNDPDFIIDDASVQSSPAYLQEMKSYRAAKGDAYIHIDIQNFSEAVFSGRIPLNVRIFSNGIVYKEIDKELLCTIKAYENKKCSLKIEGIEKGEYTARVTLNPDLSVTEAFIMNNEYSFDFEIAGSEYDVSGVSVQAGVQEKPDIDSVEFSFSYSGLPDDHLKDIDKISFNMLGYDPDNDQWSQVFMYVSEKSSDYPDFPLKAVTPMSSPKFRLCLTILKDSTTYVVLSNEVNVTRVRTDIVLTENNTNLSPLKYGSDTFAQGEQIALKILNKSFNYRGKIEGTLNLAAYDEDSFTSKDISEPFDFCISEDAEESNEIIIKSLNIPLYRSADLSFIIKYNALGRDSIQTISFDNIKVEEKQSNTVDYNGNDDPYDGKTTFSEALKYCAENQITKVLIKPLAENLTVDEDIIADGELTICGTDSEKVPVLDFKKGRAAVRVTENGNLTFSNLILKDSDTFNSSENFIVCSGGKVNIKNCRLNWLYNICDDGLICMNGGSLLIEDCYFNGVKGNQGIINVRNGAQVNILNTLINSCYALEYLINNHDGTLNIINSMFLYCSSLRDTNTAVVNSLSDTNLINTVFAENYFKNDIIGDAQLFCCAYQRAGEDVHRDIMSGIYKNEELFCLNKWNGIEITDDESSVKPVLKVRDKIKEGCIVINQGGILFITKDNETYIDTSVKSTLSNDQLKYDIEGIERRAVFGPYTKLYNEYLCGDSDGNNRIDICDATIIRYHIANIYVPYDPDVLNNGDTDADGILTVADATVIQMYLANLDISCPVGSLVQKRQ